MCKLTVRSNWSHTSCDFMGFTGPTLSFLDIKGKKLSNQSHKDGYRYTSTPVCACVCIYIYIHTHTYTAYTRCSNKQQWKVKLSLCTSYRGSVGVAPLILNLGTRWRWVISLIALATLPLENIYQVPQAPWYMFSTWELFLLLQVRFNVNYNWQWIIRFGTRVHWM